MHPLYNNGGYAWLRINAALRRTIPSRLSLLAQL